VAVVAVQCPECESQEVVRYGRQANGEQRYRCNKVDCERRIFLARYQRSVAVACAGGPWQGALSFIFLTRLVQRA